MSGDMVKRVARAIALASYPNARDEIDTRGIAYFADLVEENFVEAARAAIEAMREPTEAMLEAAGATGTYGGIADNGGLEANDFDPSEVWPAMIDAALGKP